MKVYDNVNGKSCTIDRNNICEIVPIKELKLGKNIENKRMSRIITDKTIELIQNGDIEAQNLFLEDNYGFIYDVVKNYINNTLSTGNYDFIDLFNEAVIAFIEQIYSYKGNENFKAVVTTKIKRRLDSIIGEQGNIIKQNRNHQYNRNMIYKNIKEAFKCDKDISIQEIDNDLEPESLYEPTIDNYDDISNISLDYIHKIDEKLDEDFVYKTFCNIANLLCKNDRNAQIVIKAYGFDKNEPVSIKSLAEEYSLNRATIARILDQFKDKLEKNKHILKRLLIGYTKKCDKSRYHVSKSTITNIEKKINKTEERKYTISIGNEWTYITINDLKSLINENLFDKKEEELLRLLFGLDGTKKYTIEEVAEKYNVPDTFIWNIRLDCYRKILDKNLHTINYYDRKRKPI